MHNLPMGLYLRGRIRRVLSYFCGYFNWVLLTADAFEVVCIIVM